MNYQLQAGHLLYSASTTGAGARHQRSRCPEPSHRQRTAPAFTRAMAAAQAAVTAAAAPCQQQQAQQQGMQLLLYDDPHSEYCAKVKVALYHKGLSWQTLSVKPCGDTQSLEFQQRVPLRKIPALVVVQSLDGAEQEVVLYESEVINEWLDEQFPHPPLLPATPLLRSKARLISRFHDLYLEPALRQLYPHVAPCHRNRQLVEAAAGEFHMRLGQLEAMLQDSSSGGSSSSSSSNSYAVGSSLSLADCGYPGLLLYAEMIFPVLGLGKLDYSRVPYVAQWRQCLWQDASVARVLQELQPAAHHWVESKLQQR